MPSSDERANLVDTCPETRESEIQPLSVRQGSISPWANAASWDFAFVYKEFVKRRVQSRAAVRASPDRDAETRMCGLTPQAVGVVEGCQRFGRSDVYLGQAYAVDHVAMTSAVGSGGEDDVSDHIPFYAIATALQRSATIALEPAAPNVPKQADCHWNVEKDEVGRSFQPLEEQSGAIAFDHPVVASDRRIVQRRELVWRSWNPVGVREMA